MDIAHGTHGYHGILMYILNSLSCCARNALRIAQIFYSLWLWLMDDGFFFGGCFGGLMKYV